MDLSLLEEMELVEADGIDFIRLMVNPRESIQPFNKIIASFTKEEFSKGVSYPRASYKLWKMVDGKKVYMVL